jgi:hypothetical protein
MCRPTGPAQAGTGGAGKTQVLLAFHELHHSGKVEGEETCWERLSATTNWRTVSRLQTLAEGEGFEPPEPLPVQWFSRPFMGGRSIGSSQFTPIKRPFSAHALGADWGLSAPGHGQKADSLGIHRSIGRAAMGRSTERPPCVLAYPR